MCYILDSEEIVGIWILAIIMAASIIYIGLALLVKYYECNELSKKINDLKKQNQNLKTVPQNEETVTEYEAKIKIAADKVEWARRSVAKKDEIIDCLIRKNEEKERESKNLESQLGDLKDKNERLVAFLHKVTEERDELLNVVNLTKSIEDATEEFRSVTTAKSLCGTVQKFVEDYIDGKLRLAKKNGALSATAEMERLRRKISEICQEYTMLKIYHERILLAFPELEDYIGETTLITAGEGDDEQRDSARAFLSDEEYRRLDENSRNQLALDRYKESGHRKNKWVVGVEYEMSYSYRLREKGYRVEECGAENGLNDLGRDIIAHKDGWTYIIQCKRYAQGARVHENVICQLLGTMWHYIVTTPHVDPQKVKAALVTTAELSDTAQRIAEVLGVEIRRRGVSPYPMIKCNINHGNKIYHLPFDPQYWRTKIDISRGESYEWTVKDAVNKEFRRARRN